MIGEEFYIYAARGRSRTPRAASLGAEEAARQIWSDDLAVTDRADGRGGDAPPWMLELAEPLILGRLPTGVLVGTASSNAAPTRSGPTRWHPARVTRLGRPGEPTCHPPPARFRPF